MGLISVNFELSFILPKVLIALWTKIEWRLLLGRVSWRCDRQEVSRSDTWQRKSFSCRFWFLFLITVTKKIVDVIFFSKLQDSCK